MNNYKLKWLQICSLNSHHLGKVSKPSRQEFNYSGLDGIVPKYLKETIQDTLKEHILIIGLTESAHTIFQH